MTRIEITSDGSYPPAIEWGGPAEDALNLLVATLDIAIEQVADGGNPEAAGIFAMQLANRYQETAGRLLGRNPRDMNI